MYTYGKVRALYQNTDSSASVLGWGLGIGGVDEVERKVSIKDIML